VPGEPRASRAATSSSGASSAARSSWSTSLRLEFGLRRVTASERVPPLAQGGVSGCPVHGQVEPVCSDGRKEDHTPVVGHRDQLAHQRGERGNAGAEHRLSVGGSRLWSARMAGQDTYRIRLVGRVRYRGDGKPGQSALGMRMSRWNSDVSGCPAGISETSTSSALKSCDSGSGFSSRSRKATG
jgi:hypothetical protein